MTGDIPTLAVIGTADSRYDPTKIVDTATLKWQVYDDLNHSLEYDGDWSRSLAILGDIMAVCDGFIDKHTQQ